MVPGLEGKYSLIFNFEKVSKINTYSSQMAEQQYEDGPRVPQEIVERAVEVGDQAYDAETDRVNIHIMSTSTAMMKRLLKVSMLSKLMKT